MDNDGKDDKEFNLAELLEQSEEFLIDEDEDENKPEKVSWDKSVHNEEDQEEFDDDYTLPETSTCMFCGFENSVDRKLCSKCSKILIKSFTPGQSNKKNFNFKEDVMVVSQYKDSHISTAHIKALLQAGLGFINDTVSLDEFKQTIQRQRQRVLKGLKRAPKIIKKLKSNETEEAEEVATLLQGGLNLYNSALDKIESYFVSENIKDITSGLEMAQVANDQLHKVQVLTSKNK